MHIKRGRRDRKLIFDSLETASKWERIINSTFPDEENKRQEGKLQDAIVVAASAIGMETC